MKTLNCGGNFFWQFWCVLLSRMMRFPPHLATNRFLSMTRTWYGSDLSKPIQGSKSYRLILRDWLCILEAKIASYYSPLPFQNNQKRNCYGNYNKRKVKSSGAFFLSILRTLPGLNFAGIELYLPKAAHKVLLFWRNFVKLNYDFDLH